MSIQPDKPKESTAKKAALGIAAIAVIASVGYFSYRTLAGIKAKEGQSESTQEQFAGGAQISEQLQLECQKSVEKISVLHDAQAMFSEYKKNVENCREVYFRAEKKSKIRSEGTYPDIVVDIAALAARTDRTKALEILSFAKTINPWEFYMGPIVCNSLATIEAYFESLSLAENKICFKVSSDKEKLFTEIKNKNFSVLSKSLSNDRVVSVGSPESEEGCPEKISIITKLVQDAAVGNVEVSEEEVKNSENNAVNFVFKTKEEDKLILEFAAVNDCLQLHTVLLPDQPTNE